jgi:hypothetical protein
VEALIHFDTCELDFLQLHPAFGALHEMESAGPLTLFRVHLCLALSRGFSPPLSFLPRKIFFLTLRWFYRHDFLSI